MNLNCDLNDLNTMQGRNGWLLLFGHKKLKECRLAFDQYLSQSESFLGDAVQ